MNEPTETEIEAYRQERMRSYLAEDWNEALQELDDAGRKQFGSLMQHLVTSPFRSTADARQFADRLAGTLYARMLSYWAPIVERDVQEWIDEYPERAAITEGERRYDARKELDDTLIDIARSVNR